MVENYGESIQDRSIPNPVTTFAEAYADYRELSHCIPFFKYRTFHTKDFLHKSSSTSFGDKTCAKSLLSEMSGYPFFKFDNVMIVLHSVEG